MTGVVLMGGLGNMMFQIATGETWRRQGVNVGYTNMDGNFSFISDTFITKTLPSKYKNIFVNFDWVKHKISEKDRASLIHEVVPYHYVDFEKKNGVEYIGYYQSEKNFPDKEFIKHVFELSDNAKAELCKYDNLFQGTTCSVHVRRGDYVGQSHIYPFPGIEYYNKAIYTLQPFNVDRYLVFSDDIMWCKEQFRGEEYVFIENDDYVDLFLMKKCTHHVIANSSFSWWGAWLGENESSVIIAPKTWLVIEGKDTKDVIPERWIKL